MENMSDIQEERKQIRQQLDMAYSRKDKEGIIKAAKELSDLAERIIKTKH